MEWVANPFINPVIKKIKNSGRQFIQHGDNVVTLTTPMNSIDFNAIATIHIPAEGTGPNPVTTRGPLHTTHQHVVTVRSGVGSTSAGFTETTHVQFAAGNNKLIQSSVLDVANQVSYWATNDSPAKIVSVNNTTMTVIGVPIALNAGENAAGVAIAAGGFVYIGTQTSPARIVKVDITNPGNPVRVGAITLNAGENNATAMVVDTLNNILYVSCGVNSIIIVKIDLGTFTRIGSVSPGGDFLGTTGAAIDAFNGFAYFCGEGTLFGKILKVRLSDFTANAIYTTSNDGGSGLFSLVIDTGGGFLYAGDNENPAVVFKVSLNTFAEVAKRTLNTGSAGALTTAVRAEIDTLNRFAYFISNDSPAKVSKVNLVTFSETASIALSAGPPSENDGESSVIDTTNGLLYVGTNTSTAIVSKINISPLTTTGSNNRMFVKLHGGWGFNSCGVTGAGNTNQSARFDEDAGWTSVNGPGTARNGLAGFSINGYNFAAEGIDAVSAVNGLTDRWDFITNVFAARTADINPRFAVPGFTINGFGFTSSGLLAGGLSSTFNNRFDDGANQWTQRTSTFPDTFDRHAAFGLNNFGFIGLGNPLNSSKNKRFDDIANSWTNRQSWVTPRKDTAGASMRGFGYTSCGVTGAPAVTGVTERFDDVTNATPVTRLADPNARMAIAMFSLNGFIFTCNGTTSTTEGTAGNVTNVDRFDEISNQWTARAAGLGNQRQCGSAANEFFVNYQVSEP